MIFSELQVATAALLTAASIFTGPPKCNVYWDGQKEDENKKPLETAKAIQRDLVGIGVSGVVTQPEITVEDTVYLVASTSVIFIENPKKNRGASGSGVTAYEWAEHAMALTVGEQVAPWSEFLFEGLHALEVHSEGLIAWELKIQCRTLISIES